MKNEEREIVIEEQDIWYIASLEADQAKDRQKYNDYKNDPNSEELRNVWENRIASFVKSAKENIVIINHAVSMCNEAAGFRVDSNIGNIQSSVAKNITNLYTASNNLIECLCDLVTYGGVEQYNDLLGMVESAILNVGSIKPYCSVDTERSISEMSLYFGYEENTDGMLIEASHVNSKVQEYCSRDKAIESMHISDIFKCLEFDIVSIERVQEYFNKDAAFFEAIYDDNKEGIVKCIEHNIITIDDERVYFYLEWLFIKGLLERNVIKSSNEAFISWCTKIIKEREINSNEVQGILDYIIEKNDVDLLQKLYEDTNGLYNNKLIQAFNAGRYGVGLTKEKGLTTFHMCILKGKTEVVAALLEKSEFRLPREQTFIELSCGDEDMFKVLLNGNKLRSLKGKTVNDSFPGEGQLRSLITDLYTAELYDLAYKKHSIFKELFSEVQVGGIADEFSEFIDKFNENEDSRGIGVLVMQEESMQNKLMIMKGLLETAQKQDVERQKQYYNFAEHCMKEFFHELIDEEQEGMHLLDMVFEIFQCTLASDGVFDDIEKMKSLLLFVRLQYNAIGDHNGTQERFKKKVQELLIEEDEEVEHGYKIRAGINDASFYLLFSLEEALNNKVQELHSSPEKVKVKVEELDSSNFELGNANSEQPNNWKKAITIASIAIVGTVSCCYLYHIIKNFREVAPNYDDKNNVLGLFVDYIKGLITTTGREV